jgi:probable HAF family extracellular repeat protein
MKAKTLYSTFVPASLLRRLRPLMRPSPILPSGRADDEWSNEMSILQKLLIITTGVALITLGTVAEAWQTSYSITDLGTTFVPLDINKKGQIAGASGDGRALLYSDGRFTEISKLRSNDNEITARAINNKGQVVGDSTNIGVSSRIFLYSNGITQDLGIEGSAYNINNKGQVVGGSSGGAFLYSNGITTIINSNNAIAYGINDKGQVVGYSGTPNTAFLYDNGITNDLGTLPPYDSSAASAINNKGQVVGNLFFSAFPPIYDTSAFLYSRRTGMTNLGRLLPTDIFRVAADINNKGQVVGYSGTFSGFRAFISSDDGVLQDLNNLIPLSSGFTLNFAHAINDKGELVGTGLINGQQHGFLLRPAASSCEDCDR